MHFGAPSFLEHYEDWLNLAVFDINEELRLGGETEDMNQRLRDLEEWRESQRNRPQTFVEAPRVEESERRPLPTQKVKMTSKLQGLASKMAKFTHAAEFEAEKLDTKVEGATARMPGIFSRAHGHVDRLTQTFDEVEGFVSSIDVVTNGGPPLVEPEQK